MMRVLIFLFFVLPFLKNLSRDERRSDGFRAMISIYILCVVLGSVFSGPIAGIAVIALLIYACNKWKKKKESKERRERYGWDPERWNEKEQKQKKKQKQNTWNGSTGNYTSARSTASRSDAAAGRVFSVILPKQVSKRRKIVQEFNKKYKLYLTDEQIKGIVDSTYMSETWKREVEAMAGKYETVYEWFQGDTKWLRAYLHAFHVQDVTSDFVQQERIVVTAFEEIMRYSDSISQMPLSERIREINSKYYTNFDDVTYMIAYRFLESRGLFHTLETVQPVRDDSDLDELMKKYQSMPIQ